jgi:DNA-binding NarL/FixJ family response regulator
VRETASTRVLVADDHTLFREGIVEICRTAPDLDVVAQAASGDEVVRLVRRDVPDVVLLDLEMPGPPLDQMMMEISLVPVPPRIAILTMHDDARLIGRSLSLGAHAYISKGSSREQLLAAIRAVRGQSDRAVISVPKETVRELGEPRQNPLSARECEVLGLVSNGFSNAQIATRLYITEGTVKRHLTNIYLKLDVRSRMNAVNKATAMHLIGA